MSVITEDGSFYTFNVKYAKEPLMLNIGKKINHLLNITWQIRYSAHLNHLP